jgi:pantoate--beta-alanine ligase
MAKVISSIAELRELTRSIHGRNEEIGFVPTMGALHTGHLSLVEAAKRDCRRVLVSIFVNPTQFGPGEDFTRYPRTLETDLKLLEPYNIDGVFCPSVEEMYPQGFQTTVDVPELAKRWEGSARPTHYRGVATVVLKLLQATSADRSYFGKKDYQQLRVIERMVTDLNLPSKICACPIVRDTDGLALSSRNKYLSPDDRKRALVIPRAVEVVRELAIRGVTDCGEMRTAMHDILDSQKLGIDYATVVDRETLTELSVLDRPAVAIIAAKVGNTRLLDNQELDVVTNRPNEI